MSAEPWDAAWTTIQPLGKGGQGSAFLVQSLDGSERRGVLKVLLWNESKKARGRMRREVVSLETLAREGLRVPAVLGGNTEDYGSSIPLYFVMEHIRGPSLEAFVEQRGRLSLDEAVAFLGALADVVSSAHRMKIFHRDLKPDNIIVRDAEKRDLVVVDYGLSFNDADGSAQLTETAEQFRSRFLAVPETNTPGGDRPDHRTDITALCAILFFCLTGHRPGQLRDSRGRPIHRSDECSVRKALEHDPRCEQVELLLDRGLAYDVESRFQSFEEMLSRLTTVSLPDLATAEDPVDVAAEVTTRLSRDDRTVRLDSFMPYCNELFAGIQNYVASIQDKLGRTFTIQIGGMDHRKTKVFPEFTDKVGDVRVISITRHPHGMVRRVHYCVGANGAQCVLLRHFDNQGMGASHRMPGSSETEWDVVRWFDPEQRPPFADFRPCVQHDISRAIRDLGDESAPAEA